jgi:hypothetical protein
MTHSRVAPGVQLFAWVHEWGLRLLVALPAMFCAVEVVCCPAANRSVCTTCVKQVTRGVLEDAPTGLGATSRAPRWYAPASSSRGVHPFHTPVAQPTQFCRCIVSAGVPSPWHVVGTTPLASWVSAAALTSCFESTHCAQPAPDTRFGVLFRCFLGCAGTGCTRQQSVDGAAARAPALRLLLSACVLPMVS